jgi:hypothetical protein
MVVLRVAICVAFTVCACLIYEATAERTVSWEVLEAALRDAEREALENELYHADERDKRGPMNFRFRGAKRNADEQSNIAPVGAPSGEQSRPKRSPLSFRFRGAKRAPSSGFFGMRGKKDEWDSYNQYDDIQEEKRGPLNFRFRGA